MCGAQPYHEGLSCEEHRKKERARGDDDSFMKWMKETGTKQCPKCGMATSKENLDSQTDQVEECHKMLCRSCGTKFCFGCGAVLTETYTCGCTQNAHNFVDPHTGKLVKHLQKLRVAKAKAKAKAKSRWPQVFAELGGNLIQRAVPGMRTASRTAHGDRSPEAYSKIGQAAGLTTCPRNDPFCQLVSALRGKGFALPCRLPARESGDLHAKRAKKLVASAVEIVLVFSSRSLSPRSVIASCTSAAGLATSVASSSPARSPAPTPAVATTVETKWASPCHRYVQPTVRHVVAGNSSPCRYTIAPGERRCYSPQVVRTYQFRPAVPRPQTQIDPAATRTQVWPNVVQGIHCIFGDAGVPPPPLKNPTLSILIRDFEMQNPGLAADWEGDLSACGRCAKHISSMLLELALGDRILVPLAPGGPSVPVSTNGPEGRPSQTWQQAFSACCPALRAALRLRNTAKVEACFAQASCSNSGALGWRTGEVQRFMRLCFDSLGLPAPLCHPAVWYQLLREVTTDPAARLPKELAGEFLQLFLERLLSFQLAQQETEPHEEAFSRPQGSRKGLERLSLASTRAEDIGKDITTFAGGSRQQQAADKSPITASCHASAPASVITSAVVNAGTVLGDSAAKVKFSPHVVKLDDGSSVPSTMTPGSGTGQERRVLEDMIPSSGTVASPSMFTGPVASPPRQSFEVKEAKSSPKAPSPGTGEIPSPSFPARGPCTSHYSFGPLSFQREEEVPALGSPPQPPQEFQNSTSTTLAGVPHAEFCQFLSQGIPAADAENQPPPTETRREPYEAEVCRLLEAVQGACSDLALRLEHQRQIAPGQPAPGAQWYDMSTPALPLSTSGSLRVAAVGDDVVEDPCPMLRPPAAEACYQSWR
ncbi:unnamed protein product [Symbiodinium natans]|uniref:RING-type domain-containing protein n=1 Tax=Symbiodinium natans TaxID=878477 RepID=A0A812NFP7_9DINO|nr:unnamed protein product [Symbiodinium natans]